MYFYLVHLHDLGTVLSGFAVFCCGKTRLDSKEDETSSVFCTNCWVGFAQLFTVTFMLVGWFWSLTWGIYMIILAGRWQHLQDKPILITSLICGKFWTTFIGQRTTVLLGVTVTCRAKDPLLYCDKIKMSIKSIKSNLFCEPVSFKGNRMCGFFF